MARTCPKQMHPEHKSTNAHFPCQLFDVAYSTTLTQNDMNDDYKSYGHLSLTEIKKQTVSLYCRSRFHLQKNSTMPFQRDFHEIIKPSYYEFTDMLKQVSDQVEATRFFPSWTN